MAAKSVAENAVFMAHMRSLKHWSLKKIMTFEDFVVSQTDFLLGSLMDDKSTRPAQNPARAGGGAA